MCGAVPQLSKVYPSATAWALPVAADDAAAKEFQNSPEYQEISMDRKAGADAIVLTVRGLS